MPRSSHALAIAGSRWARSAFIGKSVCGRLIVCLYLFGSDTTRLYRCSTVQYAPRLGGIEPHLRGERIQIAEALLVPQLGHELHLDLLPVQLAGEIEHMHLEQRLNPRNGRASPETGDAWQATGKARAGPMGPHGEYPRQWHSAPLDLEVRSWKAKRSSQLIA